MLGMLAFEMRTPQQEVPLNLSMRSQLSPASRDQYVTQMDVWSAYYNDDSGPIDLRTNGRAERIAKHKQRPARQHPYSMAAMLGLDDDSTSSQPITAQLPNEAEVTKLHYNEDMMNMDAWFKAAAASNNYTYPTGTPPVVSPVLPTDGMVQQKVSTAPKVASWCHCCNKWISTINEVNHHQLGHYMNKDKCTLQCETFERFGYVTHHVYLDDSTLQCSICKRSRKYFFFGKHQKSHDGHICSTCDNEYKSETLLQYHMNRSGHNGGTPNVKNTNKSNSSKPLSRRKSGNQHKQCHANEGRFYCSYCNRAFSKKYTMHVHERIHTGDTPFVCHVIGCDKRYPQKVQLEKHIARHLVGDAPSTA